MDCDKAQELAINALYDHLSNNDVSLWNDGWTFSWSNRKRAAGHVQYSTRTLFLSREFVRINEESIVRDVILHEIAHAMVGPGHGHDKVWKWQARALGANPKSCVDSSAERVQGIWEAVCDTHGSVGSMHRAPGRVRSCTHCSPRRFDLNSILSWRKHGKDVPHDQMPSAKYRSEYRRLRARAELLEGAV